MHQGHNRQVSAELDVSKKHLAEALTRAKEAEAAAGKLAAALDAERHHAAAATARANEQALVAAAGCIKELRNKWVWLGDRRAYSLMIKHHLVECRRWSACCASWGGDVRRPGGVVASPYC